MASADAGETPESLPLNMTQSKQNDFKKELAPEEDFAEILLESLPRKEKPLTNNLVVSGNRTFSMGLSKTARKRNNRRAVRGLSVPPPLDTTPSLRHVFRFACSTSGTYNVVVNSLLAACGGICTVANSTIVTFASAVKVHRVSIWPAPNSTTVEANGVQFSSSSDTYSRDESKGRDVPDGITVTGAVTAVPPPNSSAAFWATSTASRQLFVLQITAGSIVDVDLSICLANTLTGASITGLTTAVLGTTYYLALDGRASNKVTPLRLPTTS